MWSFEWENTRCSRGNDTKIKMIKQIAPTLVIVARTDARSVEGLEQAILRAKAYVAAGADAIFPEALQTEKEFKHFASELDAPLLANMTEFGQTPYYTAKEFEKMGYSMVIYPVTSMRVAAKAYEQVFGLIKRQGLKKKLLRICKQEVNYMKPFPITNLKI